MTAIPMLCAAPRAEPLVCSFVVMGEPVPCARPRARLVTPRHGKPFIHMHPDERTAEYEKLVGLIAQSQRPRSWRTDWAGYDLRIRVYQAERRGDGDNFLKAVADGCHDILWGNDRRIRRWSVDVIDELTKPRLEVLASMVGDLDIEQDRRARARLLAMRRKDGR